MSYSTWRIYLNSKEMDVKFAIMSSLNANERTDGNFCFRLLRISKVKGSSFAEYAFC
jgi:hypothetical protein